MDPQNKKSYYGKEYFTSAKISNYRDYQKFSNQKLYKDILGLILLLKNKGNLLEIGCAYGFLLRHAEKYFSTYGIDISSYAINQAKRFTQKSKLLVGDIEREIKKYPDIFFDVIIGIDVMEHLENPSYVLSEIYKKLKEDGIFIFRVPNKNSMMFFILNLFRLKKRWHGYQDKTHVSLFNIKEWKKIIEKNNFKVDIYSMIPTMYLRGILNKLGIGKVFYRNLFVSFNENVTFLCRKRIFHKIKKGKSMKNFDKYSKENIHFYSESVPKLLRDLINKLNPKSLVDFGCGDGAILFDLQRKGLLKGVKNIIVVDLSKQRLERVKNYITNVETICSDVTNVKQLPDSRLDLVICTQVIEHVEDDKRLLNEIYRVLKPSGYLYISSVVKKWYGWYFYRCNGKWVLDPTHLREYSSSTEFRDLLTDNGFKILEQKLSLFKPSIGNAFYRLLIKSGAVNEKKLRESKISVIFSKIRIPIFGYYIIEVIAKK